MELPEELLQHTFSFLFNFLVGDYQHPFDRRKLEEKTPTSSKVLSEQHLFPKKTTRARKAEAIKKAKGNVTRSTAVVSKPVQKTFKISAEMIRLSNVCRSWKEAIDNTDVFWGTAWYLIQVTYNNKTIIATNNALPFTPVSQFQQETKNFVAEYAATNIIDKISELLVEVIAMKDNNKLFHEKDFLEKEEQILRLINTSAVKENAASLAEIVRKVLVQVMYYPEPSVTKGTNYKVFKRTVLNIFREFGKQGGMCLGDLFKTAYQRDHEFIPVVLELWHYYHQHNTNKEVSSTNSHITPYSCSFSVHMDPTFLVQTLWSGAHDVQMLKMIVNQTDRKGCFEMLEPHATTMYQTALRQGIKHPEKAKEMLSYLINDLRLPVPTNPEQVLLPALCHSASTASISELTKFQPFFEYVVNILSFKLLPLGEVGGKQSNILGLFINQTGENLKFLIENLMKGRQKQLKAWAENSCDSGQGGIIEWIIRCVKQENVVEVVKLVMKTGASDKILFNKVAKKAFHYSPAKFQEVWEAGVKYKFV